MNREKSLTNTISNFKMFFNKSMKLASRSPRRVEAVLCKLLEHNIASEKV